MPLNKRHALALTAAVLTALAVVGCSSANRPAASNTRTPSQTTTEDDPLEVDTSMPAACGQLSALLTVQANAADDKAEGTISDDAYRALVSAVSFGIQQIPPITEPSSSIGSAKAYLASLDDAVFDPTASRWAELEEKLSQDCRAAGSPIGVSLTHGG